MADKTKTIKNASDQDLTDLINRLRKERELQSLICDMKRNARTDDEVRSGSYYDIANVSTEVPIEDLYHNEKTDEILKHFGIPGMRWGKRSAKPPLSSDYVKSRELKLKGSKHLSNKELTDLTKRLQLEKQLRDLKTSDVLRGADVAKAILGIGTTITSLYALSTTPMGQAIKKAIMK